jgi:hypothetical protein
MQVVTYHADLPVYNRAQEAVSSTLNEETGEVEAPDSLNLIDQYVALLMATFIDAGLLDVSRSNQHATSLNVTGPGYTHRRER